MPRERRFRLPLTRLGLLLVVGSAFASLFQAYIAFGFAAADLEGEGVPTERPQLARWFFDEFLFAGTVPGLLFWAGIVLMGAGIVQRHWGRAAPRRDSLDPH